jgi:flagellar hook-length control protein FliK
MAKVLDQLFKTASPQMNAAPKTPRVARDETKPSFEKTLADARPRKTEQPKPHEANKIETKPADPAPNEAVETSVEKPQAQPDKPTDADAPADDQAAVATDEQPSTDTDTDADKDADNAEAQAEAVVAALQLQPTPQQTSDPADVAKTETTEKPQPIQTAALAAAKLEPKPAGAKAAENDAPAGAEKPAAAAAIPLPQDLADAGEKPDDENAEDAAAQVLKGAEKLTKSLDAKPADPAAPAAAPEQPNVEKHAPAKPAPATDAANAAVSASDLPADNPPAAHTSSPTAQTPDTANAPIEAAQPKQPHQAQQTAPAPAAPPVPREVEFADNNHDKIVSSVKSQLLPSGGTMRIRLDPPEMGALQVTVRMVDGVMNASFETNNDQATKLLSHSLGQLKQSLESQGVSVEKLHVQQSPRDHESNSNPDDRRQGSDTNGQSARQEQQRKEMLNRMWRRLRIGSDPLDMVA